MDISISSLLGQLMLGLVNGAFYAVLSLGLSIIFGVLNVINFTHGAQYMMGAFVAWLLLTLFGVGYWPALILAPVIVGLSGMALEWLLIRHTYKLDHLYGLLLTVGLATVIEGVFLNLYGAAGLPYPIPTIFKGGIDLGIMYLPTYRAWVIVAAAIVCAATWFLIERTRLGSYLRAATENPQLVRAFGVRVPLMITSVYGLGVGLAAFAGVLGAPIFQVSPFMGSNLIIVVFAVVVIGGMGSIAGSIVTGFGIGIIEGLTKYFWPEAANTAVFVIMTLVLMLRPMGLFGKTIILHAQTSATGQIGHKPTLGIVPSHAIAALTITAAVIIAPYFGYPVIIMHVMCFALFAMSVNLLLGYAGLVSFGHAMFFGMSGYITAYTTKEWGVTPEIGVLLGVLTAAAIGLVTGAVAIRRQSIYFAMITLAFSQMIYFFCLQAPFTGGEDGIQAVPRGMLFGLIDLNVTMNMYAMVAVLFLAGLFVTYRIIHSPFGHVMKAIRDNEPRAISLGYDVQRYKLTAFVLSAAIAGVAGSLKALVFQIASLTDVSNLVSGEVLFMALLGGLGTVFGPIAGATLVIGMQHYLSWLGSWVLLVQGAVFVIFVVLVRRGIVGEISKRLRVPL